MITRFEDLPLGKYVEMCRVFAARGDEFERQVGVIAILAGMDEDDVLNLPVMEYQSLAAKASFIGGELPTPTGKVRSSYKIGGFDLRPLARVEDMTTAQYVDFQTFCKDVGKHLADLVSVLLVPKGMKYNSGYDILKVQAAILEEMSIVEVNDVIAFFLKRCESSMRAILTYSEWIVKRMPEGMRKAETMRKISRTRALLEESGAGFRALTRSARLSGATGRK